MLRIALVSLLVGLPAVASHATGAELALFIGQSPAPSLGSQALELVLSPTGIAMLVGVLGTVLGLVFGARTVAKRRFAKAVYHAYHVVEDLAEETETPIDDKTVPFLRAIDDYCKANGWRALKPGEQELAKLEAKALHGAYAAASKAQADALVAAAEAKASPPSP